MHATIANPIAVCSQQQIPSWYAQNSKSHRGTLTNKPIEIYLTAHRGKSNSHYHNNSKNNYILIQYTTYSIYNTIYDTLSLPVYLVQIQQFRPIINKPVLTPTKFNHRKTVNHRNHLSVHKIIHTNLAHIPQPILERLI